MVKCPVLGAAVPPPVALEFAGWVKVLAEMNEVDSTWDTVAERSSAGWNCCGAITTQEHGRLMMEDFGWKDPHCVEVAMPIESWSDITVICDLDAARR